MLLALSLLSASVLFLVSLWWRTYTYSYRKHLKVLPCPKGYPILGHSLKFAKPGAILPVGFEMIKECGPTFHFWIGPEPIIVSMGVEIAEKVLSSPSVIDKSAQYRFLHAWLGTGLLTSNGPKWKKRRRILTPTYHFQILEQFVPIFDQISRNLVDVMRKDTCKSCIDVYPLVTLSTLDVICETAMGVSVNALENKDSPYVRSVKEMGHVIMERAISVVQQFDCLYKFTDTYRREQKCLKVIHGHTNGVIKQRRAELSKATTGDCEHEDDDVGQRKRIAFLDMLLRSTDNGTPLSDEDIREEVDTFMFEGHDTTASAISFALYEIAHDAHVQAKILEEQKEVLGDIDAEITYQDLMRMKYLDMVIKETLRLYPSVPFFGRSVMEDLRINKDLTLPKGATVLVLPYFLHRNPEYYPDPMKFQPDCFLPENWKGTNPYSYVPFSAGPRNCIGQKFALLEMKATLSAIVRNFKLTPSVPHHPLQLVAETILKSQNGVMIKIEERTNARGQ